MRAGGKVLLTLALVTAGLAGCLGDDADEGREGPDGGPSERWTTEAWRSALSDHVYEGMVSTVHRIEAADGTELSLTLHVPDGLPEGETVPTLLQITPYQAGRQWTPVMGTGPPSTAWRELVHRGAAYVEADARGTNGSEGCLDFGGSADRSDAQVFHAWVTSQPWSNGIVVTDGVSHPGMGSLVAHAAVPALTAALAHAPVVSYYQDQWVQGARLEQINEFYQVVESSPALYADPAALAAQAAPCTGQTLVDFGKVDGPFTETWAERDLSRHVDPSVAAPVLITHGFIDENVHPDHAQMYWDALPEDFPKHVILGWWYHGWPDLEGHPAAAFEDVRLRWLDATLFGIDNGLWAEPRVWVEDSTGAWHEGGQWPLEPSEAVTFTTSADGTLTVDGADAGELHYPDAPGTERGKWTGSSAVFRSEPLAATRLVNGAPTVTLVAASDQDETKWVAYLLDESPDGSWERIAQGYADSHTHAGEGSWEPITPGEAYTWELALLPTAVVVEEGHRIVLLVTSQDSQNDRDGDRQAPCWDDTRGGCYNPTGIVPAATAGRATNTVFTGPGATAVTLDWVDPSLTAKPPAE